MDDQDPIHQFFTPTDLESPYALYTALLLPPPTSNPDPTPSATDIRTAYRRAALRYHPDKHASKTPEERGEMERLFQRVGFAYAVLSDEGRRKRYDATGRTTDSGGMFDDAAAMGSWDAYFSAMYQRVDKKMLDEDKARYQGSEEETEDLYKAYTEHQGSLPQILSHIPHSSPTDEPRFITLLNAAIASGTLPRLTEWDTSTADEKGRRGRVRTAKREAREAEEAAREMGLWDEFYGTGAGDSTREGAGAGKKRKSGGKASSSSSSGVQPPAPAEEDTSALAALIASRQRSRESAFDALLDKYSSPNPEKRRKPTKGKRTEPVEEPGDLPTEDEFRRLQEKLFDGKTGSKRRRG